MEEKTTNTEEPRTETNDNVTRVGHQRRSKKREKKVRKPRRGKLPKLSTLPDAIVNGELMVKVDDPVMFERYVPGCSPDIDVGTIKQIDDDGFVTVWDETREQCFLFNYKAEKIPVIKALL